MIRYLTILLAACSLAACSAPSEFVVTVIGTNDVHGELMPKPGRGGLVTISGYVDAVREARDADGGAVLLIDAGHCGLQCHFDSFGSGVETTHSVSPCSGEQTSHSSSS